jgi:hypothetical protein
MITKKTYKQIRRGNMGALMFAFEDLMDEYTVDSFDNGYKACIDDLDVYAYRLAEKIEETAKDKGKFTLRKGEKYYVLDPKYLEQVIKDFFTDITNGNGRK